MTRFLHTADLQLGMPFHWIAGDPGSRVRQARMACLETIGEVARDQGAEFIVIAGDLFDANTVSERVIVQAQDRLKALGLPTYVLPGNHDHGGPDSVYHSRTFRRLCPENVTVLLDTAPRLHGDGRTLLLPAPLLRRHGVDPTSHLTASLGRDLAPDAIRVGVAHGSVHSFSRDQSQTLNRIAPDTASRADLDYLALGDWHGLYEVNPRTWYPGAPEPTAFKDNDPGHVLMVEITEHGAPPAVGQVHVAGTRWLRHSAELYSAEHVAELEGWLEGLADKEHTLLRLELKGVLSLGELTHLQDMLRLAESRLLHLRRRGEVLPAPTSDELSDIAVDGWVRAAVERLQAQAEEGAAPEAEASHAARALHLLYRLHAEGR
ncbi:MAG: DNA repair exonuclease [Alphaproteobacteria bacterium]|nr:DNA repair exonuclease [Alphaproteobacteria bacterium]